METNLKKDCNDRMPGGRPPQGAAHPHPQPHPHPLLPPGQRGLQGGPISRPLERCSENSPFKTGVGTFSKETEHVGQQTWEVWCSDVGVRGATAATCQEGTTVLRLLLCLHLTKRSKRNHWCKECYPSGGLTVF